MANSDGVPLRSDGCDSFTLTVVVPLYEGAACIGETLDSLAGQTLPLHEVIVVDDGSTDGGAEVAAAHMLQPQVIRQVNQGVACARNRGALAATGRYVAFLDQDDLWFPARHARLARFLTSRPECQALVTTERSFFLADDRARLGEMSERLHLHADHPDVSTVEELIESGGGGVDVGGVPEVLGGVSTRMLLAGPVSVTTSCVFERDLFFVAGGCATFARSLDDYWTLLNVSRLTDIQRIDEPSVAYRIHPTSTSMSTDWPLPLLTSVVAARFGGNLVARADARNPAEVPGLGSSPSFWRHQLSGLAHRGDLGALLDSLALVRLMSCSSQEQWSAIRQQLVTYGRSVGRNWRRQFRRSSTAA